MSVVNAEHAFRQGSASAAGAAARYPAYSDDPQVLADVFEADVNIAIWQRAISEGLNDAVAGFIVANPRLETAMAVSPDDTHDALREATGGTIPAELADDITELVRMFCYLLGLDRAGLRLATLNHAMCPRFHVDRVPCRLVTTYSGIATEWLTHHDVDRSKLGSGSNGQPDLVCGLDNKVVDVQRLDVGDVALLKGELWPGNEGAGLVHRSPAVPSGENRLLLSLDVSD